MLCRRPGSVIFLKSRILPWVNVDAFQIDVVRFEVEAATERIGEGARLLYDLFLHVVLVAALGRAVVSQATVMGRLFDGRAVYLLVRHAVFVRTAISPGSRKARLRVCSKIAGWSEATNISPSP